MHLLKDRFPLGPKIKKMVSLNNDTRAIYQLDNVKYRHEERTNKHTRSLVDLANEFSDRSDNRRRYFGIFKESDMQ